jgi:hypothetical protein
MGFLFAFALVAAILDYYGFVNSSPDLIILGFSFSLLGAGVAGILVGKGAAEIYSPSVADYLGAILLFGGFSAGFDVGKLLAE